MSPTPEPSSTDPSVPTDSSRPTAGGGTKTARTRREPSLGRSTRTVWLPAILGCGIAAGTAGLMVWSWLRAAATDYQSSFFFTVAVGLIGGLATLICLQRSAAAAGRPYLVLGVLTLTIATAAGLLRYEGHNGEMQPRFAWRFASKRIAPPPQDVPAAASGTSAERAAPQPASVTPTSDSPASDSPAQPAADRQRSVGFLGNDRDGVYGDASPRLPAVRREVWSIGVGDGWGSFAVDRSIAVTLEQRDQEEWVAAYSLVDGSLIWKHADSAAHSHPLGGRGPRSTPTIDGDRVYTQGAQGDVNALDLLTGRLLWHVDLMEVARWTTADSEAEIPWGRSGSPLIVDGLCVVPLGGPSGLKGRSLVALDQQTGNIVWTAGDDQISYASPQTMTVVDDTGQSQRQIVAVNESTITGHAPGDGRVLWSFDWPGDTAGGANCASVMPAGDNRFLIGKGYGGGSALVRLVPERSADAGPEPNAQDRLDATPTATLPASVRITAEPQTSWRAVQDWESKRFLKTKFNHAVIVDGVAYGLSNGALEAVDLQTCRRLWQQPRSSRYGQGQVIAAGDVLIVQDEAGDVAFCEIDPQAFRELDRWVALDAKTWNIPTLAGNRLLVRNDCEAICFQLDR